MLLSDHSTPLATPLTEPLAGVAAPPGTRHAHASPEPPIPPVAPAWPDADEATSVALLNCLVREVSAPEGRARVDGSQLVVALARTGVTLRVRLVRPSYGPSLRMAPPVVEEGRGGAAPIGWRRLSELVSKELERATGRRNPEFAEQVAAGHAAMLALIDARRRGDEGPRLVETRLRGDAGRTAVPDFVEAEQSLLTGHRFHPAPKARQGAPESWLDYAPEAGARFRLRWLAVRDDLVAEEGAAGALAAFDALGPRSVIPRGYLPLPAHPWQLSLIAGRPSLRRALEDRAILDLGPVGAEVAPTSSVRTVYVPDGDVFVKFSLNVRITNCLRKNSWHELSGAVLLDRLLAPVFEELGALFGGCLLLPEPAYRTVALADRHVYEGLGAILRGGIDGCHATPVPAAALAEPYGRSPSALVRLLAGSAPDRALAWWDAYVRLVVPPVLHAYLAYGVVIEPHLQNVLVALDEDGTPVQAVFRDLEGTKLVDSVWSARLRRDGAVDRVRESVTYDADRGWKRVVYCLFVNHLIEIGAAIGDLHPRLEPLLWRTAREHVARYAAEHAIEDGAGASAGGGGGASGGSRPPGGRARLHALLSGEPLPAKANLMARWHRSADRYAGYVAIPSPFTVEGGGVR